ncbi:hypothetical protein [Actinoplanes sp. NBRC 103695]|uniref:hypothetical protein n=1 Tax=Actinoplanes sp. NBRC 103695 TaxID=3032202 RepID=UPI0024A3E2B6|nr:hypothetical protein [Actinoplanes sp. NBRC 103695]GLZ02298.1 hypothetical protein Acsp02_95490 [Actinoplanes sp. NBRC 103695]
MFDLNELPRERTMPRAADHKNLVEGYAAAGPRRSRATSRVAVMLVSGAIVLGGGTAAAAYVAARKAEVPPMEQTQCYSKATLNDDYAKQTATATRDQSARSAVQVCTTLWQAGVLKLNSTQDGTPSEPPPLTACVLANGVAAVFPGDDRTCGQLGLPRLTE